MRERGKEGKRRERETCITFLYQFISLQALKLFHNLAVVKWSNKHGYVGIAYMLILIPLGTYPVVVYLNLMIVLFLVILISIVTGLIFLIIMMP
jgi:hypothetical protein